ncbi:MAG: 6-phosphogluconate dehydrogenase [Blastocatellia bacterium]|jgi:6-phosphogluconate dehydrogenase|nr:6-phosphogluconate dehydrogenase [Blastocatellia bacterium]
MAAADIGIAGVGVMGSNLARNIERNGFEVVVWDRDPAFVAEAMSHIETGQRINAAATPEEFVRAIKRPRKILIMVKAGPPVDWTVEQFQPFLEKDDILIDGGNSFFQDTRRREAALGAAGLRFIGSGVSGGEEGALHGPSLMPGGAREAYEEIRPIWEAIAAKTADGPCTTYVGGDAAGHFVKMVHNGIEYGDMQLIAEAYDIMRRVLGMAAREIAGVFAKWNEGQLESYLIEITSQILRVEDQETGKPLVDLILDQAEQKGTGKWTAQVALDLGIAIPTINAAIDARLMSSLKKERVAASQIFGEESGGQPPFLTASVPSSNQRETIPSRTQEGGVTSAVTSETLLQYLHDALYASKICSYAQGFSLMRAGSEEWKWGIDLSEMARIWKGGCIIRAKFLDSIKTAYQTDPGLANLMLTPELRDWLVSAQTNWREAVGVAQRHGVPAPAMAASLAYFDSYRTANLPQNLTQAQRDFFGSHTYHRSDKPELGAVHTEWESEAPGG